jgi:hypothetical protein
LNEPPVAVISGLERQYASGGTPKVFDGANSYDPDGGNITAWSWYIDGGDATPSSWYSEQSPSMTTTFRTGGHYAYVYLSVKDDEGTWSTSDVCYVHIVDLDADVDRNGVINVDDEDDEDMSTGHALVLPNCDDDNNDGIPDNWPGDNNIYTPPGFDNGDWDLDETYEPATEGPNTEVDNTADIADLAELWFHQMQFRVLPSFKIRLEVTKPSQHSFFSNLQSKDIIRIFLPNQQQNGHWVVTAGAEAVIGPENGATAEFTYQNGLLSMFGEGYNKVKFRVEGIEFGAMADITLKFYENDVVQGSDKVRMRVAPYALRNHTMGVSSSGKSVYVTDIGSSNYNLRREVLYPKYLSCLDEVGAPLNHDPWQQDGYEVGVVTAPYGSMPVFLVSPRAYRTDVDRDLAEYVHNVRLESGIGVCWRLEGMDFATGDSFGNVELRPSGSWLFCGQNLRNDIKQFFEAQDVNPRQQVNTDWLQVGHVDEVISFASTGGRTVVADPNVCWALLIWAHSIDPSNARVRVDKNPFDWKQVSAVLNDNTLRQYNFDTVMAPQRLPSIWTALGLSLPEVVTKRYSGNGQLTKGGAFVGFFPNSNKRRYRITFSNSTDYTLQYKELPSGNWIAESNPYSITGGINKNQDCIFKDAKCFILKHWWVGTFQQGDYFEFEADPSCTTIKLPVLFTGGTETAYSYMINHVNCLVDGSTVFTGQTHEQYTGNVLKNYVTNMFGKAGYYTVTYADSTYYHNGNGDIHCGTNVRR